jgi:hypothetical protein
MSRNDDVGNGQHRRPPRKPRAAKLILFDALDVP